MGSPAVQGAVSKLLLVPLQVLGTEEDVSVYDIADHPDFHFRTSDIVIRIWNSENGENDCENEVRGAAAGACCFQSCSGAGVCVPTCCVTLSNRGCLFGSDLRWSGVQGGCEQ